uniref:CS domain-containing protein n=1 Tax=Panagrolaimus sp. ES5 TaxID=591445 RepID=A0AC34FMD9_9BILA
MASTTKHPMIYWAQRTEHVLLTIEVEDMNVTLLKVEGNKFHITGSNKEGVKYDADLELYDDLKGADIRRIPTARHVELIIPKEKEEWWPRLLKTTSKVQWIKVDFNKWVDEDEENEAQALPEGMNFDFGAGGGGNNFDFSSMMGGAGGQDFGNMELPEGADDGDEEEDDMPELTG